jgi:hypothetical protein
MTLLSHLKAIQYLTQNPFQHPKSFFWLVYKQPEQEQQQEEQDAENPFLDPPFSRIKTSIPDRYGRGSKSSDWERRLAALDIRVPIWSPKSSSIGPS